MANLISNFVPEPRFEATGAVAEAVVHGSGWVAQAAALALLQLDLTVALTQAPQAPQAHQADHRAIALNGPARALLQSLGAWPEDAACPVAEMHVHDAAASLHFSAPDIAADALAWIVPGESLTTALNAALAQASRLRRIPATTALGNAPAQLHVLCEGQRGLVQTAPAPAMPYGQQAVAAVLHLSEPHDNAARQWFAGGEICALLPMLDADGMHRAALVWSVAEARAAELMKLDDASFCAALAAACPPCAAPKLLSPRQTWPLAASQPSDWMGQTDGQTWVLAGDSAHRVHPLAGLGLNLGLGDVACLARQLKTRQTTAYWRKLSDPALLRPYVRERQAKAYQVFVATDGLFQIHQLRQASASSVAAGLLSAAASAWPTLRQTGLRALQASPAAKRLLMRQATAF